MKRISVLLAVLLGVGCAVAPGYEFRNDDRPGYDRTLSVTELERAAVQGDVIVLDVRLQEDYAANPVLVPGAQYRDPENISEWSSSLPRDKPVVVYCVKGKWVSQKAASYLSSKGYDVYSLDGGIDAWQSESDSRR